MNYFDLINVQWNIEPGAPCQIKPPQWKEQKLYYYFIFYTLYANELVYVCVCMFRFMVAKLLWTINWVKESWDKLFTTHTSNGLTWKINCEAIFIRKKKQTERSEQYTQFTTVFMVHKTIQTGMKYLKWMENEIIIIALPEKTVNVLH